jgi:site-specific DNA-methyltransferase (adenine-specific)
MKTNKIYNENCLDTMAAMPDNYLDLTVTSPPYDNLRSYNGYSFDFEAVASELYRVTKDGGVVVWIVNDASVNGSETGSSFLQALYFKSIGFNIHDTMIWNKGQFSDVASLRVRYAQVFEYMFILTKGKPKTFNPIKDKPNKHVGNTRKHVMMRQVNGSIKKDIRKNGYSVKEFGQRYNIWNQSPCKLRLTHPARFPLQLIKDHIISWSNKDDIVYDPFIGSGTTALASKETKRKYIGSEISNEYYQMCLDRLKDKVDLDTTHI